MAEKTYPPLFEPCHKCDGKGYRLGGDLRPFSYELPTVEACDVCLRNGRVLTAFGREVAGIVFHLQTGSLSLIGWLKDAKEVREAGWRHHDELRAASDV